MSSARKRAARQKARREVDRLNQLLMLREHQYNSVKAMAEVLARGHDSLYAWRNDAAAVLTQFIALSSRPDEREWGAVAIGATRLLNAK